MMFVVDPEAEMRRLIGDVLASGRLVDEHVLTLDREATMASSPTWRALSMQLVSALDILDASIRRIMVGLDAGDASAVGATLAYLEADPYYFRSGYTRGRLAGRLSRVKLAEPQSSRARDLVLKVVDGDCHCPAHGIGRLARSVADNGLRRALRVRLHSPDGAVARRALRTIVYVRRPGLDPSDLQTARLLVVLDAGNSWFLSPAVERLARWMWAPQWRDELRESARHHGPQRSGANRLLEAADRPKKRRPSP
jgi:hypothetical protein